MSTLLPIDSPFDLFAALQQRLATHFPRASKLLIRDETAAHYGHPGNLTGAKHFSVTLVDPIFSGMPRLARHRLVYRAVEDWIPIRIHALRINAVAPEEMPGNPASGG